jgi:hypothetical protein
MGSFAALFSGCDKDKGEEATSDVILVDYQKRAEEMDWRWSKEHANLPWCIKHHLSDYQVETIINNPNFPRHEQTMRISDHGELIYSLNVHEWTVLTRSGDVIYIAEFSPIASGCALIAFDLETRKQLWASRLKAIGPQDHSKYRNSINIEMDDGAIIVFGNEEHGRYIELVDPETGKTIGHKRLPRISRWPG